jgi:sortase A
MRRIAGTVLIVLGLAVFAWVGVTLRWGDPITSVYTHHEQAKLEDELDELNRTWRPTPPPTTRPQRPAAEKSRTTQGVIGRVKLHPTKTSRAKAAAAQWDVAGVKRWALQFRRRLREGHAAGRIVVPRLGLRMVVVSGTAKKDLKKGPGLYNIRRKGYATSLPGMGGVVAIAGHRTTYAHPFRYIDTLRKGDRIYVQMPYGQFAYKVYSWKVVSSGNWEILHPRGFEKLVLSACNPLHSLAQRWVVFARLVGVKPPPGT